MTGLGIETLAVTTERPADHEYTSDALPDIISSGAVRSWNVEVTGCEATVGEIDPHTAAAFPADPRGEHLTLLPNSNGLGHLVLILVQGYQARFVTLDETNPTIQTIPGQLIVVPETGDDPIYYLCKYKNEKGQLPIEVSHGFESVRSYLWNMTHYHPKIRENESPTEHFVQIERALGKDSHVNFTYDKGEPTDTSGAMRAKRFGRISITGQIKIEGIQVSEDRDFGTFLLRSDGTISYGSSKRGILELSEAEKVSLYKWLEAHHQEWWSV